MIFGFVFFDEWDEFKKVLDIEVECIRKVGIFIQFDMKEICVMDDGFVQYSGVLKFFIINGVIIMLLKDQEKIYCLKLSYENGVINFYSFEEFQLVFIIN